MTEQLDTSAAAIAAFIQDCEFAQGALYTTKTFATGQRVFATAVKMTRALSAELTALRAERDAALARVEVLEKAIEWASKSELERNEIREKWYPYGGGETL